MASRSVQFATLCGLFVCTCVLVGGDEEFEGLSTLNVEHSFESGPNPTFTKRGTVTIRSIKNGVAHFSQEDSLTDTEKQDLKRLVESNSIYRIRVPIRTTNQEGSHASSFIKACLLYESALSDLLTINVDQSGNILGISISTTAPYCQGIEVSDRQLTNFNTTVDVVQTATGPAPETQIYIQKMEHEKAEKAKGQQSDNRSFFAKYWMYIVPLFIFLMFASSADPNAGGGR